MPQQPIQRRTIALVLVVLATLAAFVAIFSVWVNRQLLNTENWTATSSELLERPVIRDRVAAYLVDEMYANVDVAGEIRAALPPRAAPLAGPAAGALRSFAERAARQALARPRAQAAWEDANREAHRMLLRALEGGGPDRVDGGRHRHPEPQTAAGRDAGARRPWRTAEPGAPGERGRRSRSCARTSLSRCRARSRS